MKDSYFLFIFQVIAHMALIPLVIYGQWYHFLLAFFVYFITGCFGMTMTFHRLLSHRSWNAPVWFERVGTIAGFYGLVGSPIAWVAVHREHHRHVDTDQDPHSPEHQGFVKVQWFSMFDKVNPKYASHLLRDRFQVFLHKNYFLIHLIIFMFWLAVNPMMLVACYLAPAAVLWNLGSFVNSLNHRIGYKNFESKDSSKNLFFTGFLVWGEGWHNNHHAHPTNPNFKEKWWEFDLGGLFIKLLSIK